MTAMAREAERLRVELGERSYDIVIGEGLLADCGRLLAPVLARPRAVVVSDTTVADLYLDEVRRALRDGGIETDAITVPAGEGSKDFDQLRDLLEQLLALRLERRDTVLALGGGVIGDLAGFAAAILRRGIDFVQLPTTLLAQVDSSVGGKTAINSRHGKNLIGAFHQPRLVLADVAALASLPRRQLLAGYAEVLKYGLIGDFAFFEWLEKNAPALLAGDGEALRHAVAVSCRAKAAIVARDERETGDRALLNLGHTFAHALEAEAGYDGGLLHGEAVAVGLAMAFALSAELGLCPSQEVERLTRHLEAVGLPTSPAAVGLGEVEPSVLLAHMQQDKKVSDGRLTFILARGIGQAFISRDVDQARLAALLASRPAA